ncbi:cytochrome C554 [Rubrivivax gelatinosus]|uniref:c-type cytochrome n=1 Tax=Rubrivivax gelatinosus TaxID=28068 RepID=UPI0019087C29|nr:cytochrome c [Rubrivivax gelatinosus]MBK1616313.1 cytochrome C554 [Rubrivivax gelatinosus]
MLNWLLSLALVGTGPALAQDSAAGRLKAQACSVCHGTMGVAVHPEAPHLAGQPAAYLETQLRHYRNGQRQHPVMNVIAKPLSDSDIENLAAWFASIRVDAQGR